MAKLAKLHHKSYPFLKSVTDSWEFSLSASYTENNLFSFGCQTMSSGHLLATGDAQSVLLRKMAPGLQIKMK